MQTQADHPLFPSAPHFPGRAPLSWSGRADPPLGGTCRCQTLSAQRSDWFLENFQYSEGLLLSLRIQHNSNSATCWESLAWETKGTKCQAEEAKGPEGGCHPRNKALAPKTQSTPTADKPKTRNPTENMGKGWEGKVQRGEKTC